MPRRHGPTGKQASRAREHERQAFALRKAGATYEQIARQLGISRMGAHKAVGRVLARLSAETKADAAVVRELELARLDELLMGIWDRARRGETECIDRAIKILHRRAVVSGLDSSRLGIGLSIDADSPVIDLTFHDAAAGAQGEDE